MTSSPLRCLLPEERLLIAIVALTALLLLGHGIEPDVQRVLRGYSTLFGQNLCLLFLATRLRQAWRARRDPSLPDITLAHDLTLLRVTGHLCVWISTYSNIKTRIPLLNGAVHDEPLRAAEAAILGFDLVTEMRALSAYPWVTEALDAVYHHDYVFLTFSAFLLLDRRLRGLRQLITAMGLLYVVGISITALWPTLGPCFTEREAYTWMREQGLSSWGSQSWLLKNYRLALEAAEAGTTNRAIAFTGVAALPSLHVGHCLMLCQAAWRHHRWALWLYVPITILTWVATLAFGWHYLADGLAALLLVPPCWWLAGKVVGAQDGDPVKP